MTIKYDSFLSLTIENKKLQKLKEICKEKDMTFQDFFKEEILMKKLNEIERKEGYNETTCNVS